ncbi:unnamed protein product, partial [Mesorhabditis belari]|uniref:Uncharacterized protein n=1 Tax=Mesorhabditis belari TaxID=2138241 RepID=A0AAF3EVD5_9BILA
MTESLKARVKRVSTVYDHGTGVTRRFITLCEARGECILLEDDWSRLDFQGNEVLKIENLDRKPLGEICGYARVDYKLQTRKDTKIEALASVPSTTYQPSYPTIIVRFLEVDPRFKPAPKSGTEEKPHLVQDVNGDDSVYTLREFRNVNGDGHELSYDRSKIYKLYNVKIYQDEHLIHFSHYGLSEAGGDDSFHFSNSKVPKAPLIPFPIDYKLLSEDENFQR